MSSTPSRSILTKRSKPGECISSWFISREIGRSSCSKGSSKRQRTSSISSTAPPASVVDLPIDRIPDCLSERTIHLERGSVDKIFCAIWNTKDSVLCGTKDNKLLELSSDGRVRNVPFNDGACPMSIQSGMHAIAINPSGSIITTGGSNASDTLVLHESDSHHLTPGELLVGHQDWVFGMDFIEDSLLATASRDCSVCLWRLSSSPIPPSPEDIARGQVIPHTSPLLIRKEHTMKVRALKYNPITQQLGTLSADGRLLVWDRNNFDVISKVALTCTDELSCMAIDTVNNVMACGSRDGVMMIDPRVSRVTTHIDSQNDEWGVRSLSFQRGKLLTIGGGMGLLSFFDLRAGKFRTFGDDDTTFKAASRGWMNFEGSGLEGVFTSSADAPVALYTHAFDPSGTKLFVGGGPLMVGLKGAYAAFWD